MGDFCIYPKPPKSYGTAYLGIKRKPPITKKKKKKPKKVKRNYVKQKKAKDKNFPYKIVLFCNKKVSKIVRLFIKKYKILEEWDNLKTQKRPRFLKIMGGKKRARKEILDFELALLYPKTGYEKVIRKIYRKDKIGRNVEVVFNNKDYKIKEIIPYFVEEYIFDKTNNKMIRYHELLEQILKIDQITQIFKLHCKVFVQIEDEFKMYGLKNNDAADRLIDLLKEDILDKKRNNFIIVKDISTIQREYLYDMLEKKGFNRRDLTRQYSY